MSEVEHRLFGWCLDTHHAECRVEFTSEGRRWECGCKCHSSDADSIGEITRDLPDPKTKPRGKK